MRRRDQSNYDMVTRLHTNHNETEDRSNTWFRHVYKSIVTSQSRQKGASGGGEGTRTVRIEEKKDALRANQWGAHLLRRLHIQTRT